MNIFVTTSSLGHLYSMYDLEEVISKLSLPLTEHTFMTTNRPQDSPFIDFFTISGLNFKVFAIRDILVDEVFKELAMNIDKLLLYGNIYDYYLQKMFGHCNSLVWHKGEKIPYNKFEKELNEKYKAMMLDLKNLGKIDLLNDIHVYDDIVTARLQEVGNIDITIKNFE